MVEQFVVDNSVVMSWCFKDETNNYADTVLDRLTEAAAVVPSIWPLEVVNILLVAERQKRLSESDSIRFITLLSQLPIVVEHERSEMMMKELLALARANNLSSYDASYLALAMRRGFPIATLDNKLIQAAGRIDVPILAASSNW
jgi:predicted nucleic acid-binding protein